LAPILDKARASNVVAMDRWRATFHGLPDSHPHKDPVVVNAYLGVGIDAEIALKFHETREANPSLFFSRTFNKFIYTNIGVTSAFTSMLSSKPSFPSVVKLEVNGVDHPLPDDLAGICLLNLPSWGGGKNPWGPEDASTGFHPQVIDDSILEIIGFSGAFHLGQIQVGMSYALRVAQAKKVKITISSTLPMQIDGEAWTMDPCSIEVDLLNKTKMLVYADQEYKPPVGHPLKDRTRVEVKELASFVFTVDKLEAVHKQHGDKQLNKKEFIEVLNQITGLNFDQSNPDLTDRLFNIFDTDKSGSVDFKELSAGLSVLGSGSLDKKIGFVFSLFDKGTGHINKEQLSVTFRTLFSMLYTGESEQLVDVYVTLLLALYDENKDGSITLEELKIAAKNDEVLAHLFTFGSHHHTAPK
jgi:Ca2+-binding EF-hand superfamily protein